MDKGIILTLKVEKKEDLRRDVIKSEYGVIQLKELGFDIPNNTKNGLITTIEGIFKRAHDELAYE